MRKKMRMLPVLIIMALALLSSCSDKGAEEDMTRTVTIGLANVTDPSTRTIRPDTVRPAGRYDVTLTETALSDGVWTDVPEGITKKASAEGTNSIKIDSVQIGTYRVSVEGWTDGELVLEGSSAADTPLSVAPNGANSISITLTQVYAGDSHTGTVEIPVDWSAAASSSQRMQDLMADGGIVIKMVSQEDGEQGTVLWTSPASGTSSTSMTISATLPVTPSKLVSFDIYDSTGKDLIASGLYPSVIWVASGNTSRPMDGQGDFIITPDLISYGVNVRSASWTFNSDNPQQYVDISWQNRTGLFDTVTVFYKPLTGSAEEAHVTVEVDAEDATSTAKIGPLTPDVDYEVSIQAHHRSGLISRKAVQDFTVRTKIPVSGMKISLNDVTDGVITSGSPFSASVTYTPDNASIQTHTWSVDVPDVVEILQGDNFTAKRPGQATLTATSTDNKSVSAEASISVRLAAPGKPAATAQSNGISLSWAGSEYATSYDVYRFDNNGDTAFIGSSEKTSYLDENVLASHTYSYAVVAKATEYDGDNFKVDSEQGAKSDAIRIADGSISLDIPSIDEGINIDLAPDGSIYYISKDNPKITISLASPVPGATKYIWQVDNGASTEVVKEGSYEKANYVIFNYEDTWSAYENGMMTLNLVIEDANGQSHNNSLTFYVIEDFVEAESVVLDAINGTGADASKTLPLSGDAYRVSSRTSDDPKSKRSVQIKAHVYPTNATLQGITYTTSDSSIATVSPNGLVTFAGGTGKVTITGTPMSGIPLEVTFDVYDVTVNSALELLKAVNTTIRTVMIEANGKFEGDWWAGSDGVISGRSYSNNGISINTPSSSESTGTITIRIVEESNGPVSIEGIGDIEIETIDGNILFSHADNWTYLGQQNLQTVGVSGSVPVTVTLPGNQGTATITYDNVVVNGDRNGYYHISFDQIVGYDCFVSNAESGMNTTIDDAEGIVKLLY